MSKRNNNTSVESMLQVQDRILLSNDTNINKKASCFRYFGVKCRSGQSELDVKIFRECSMFQLRSSGCKAN